MLYEAASVFFFILLTAAKRFPFIWPFIWRNRKKSQGARSGLIASLFLISFYLNVIYSLGGLGQMARFFFVENNTEFLTSAK